MGLVSFWVGLETAAGLVIFGATELATGAGVARGFGTLLSFATGFFMGWVLFGCGNSGLSAVFAADEVVGRIILERKESGAAAAAGRLGREGCFFRVDGGGPSDGLPLVRLGDRD